MVDEIKTGDPFADSLMRLWSTTSNDPFARAAKNLDYTFPEGPNAEIEPKMIWGEQPQEKPIQQDFGETEQDAKLQPLLETLGFWTTQPIAAAVSGLTGMTMAGKNRLRPISPLDEKEERDTATEKEILEAMEVVQEKLGYTPKTEGGKALTEATELPFLLLHKAGKWAGEKTLEKTESPEWATLVHTLIEGAPAIAMGMKYGKPHAQKVARGVAEGWNRIFEKTKVGQKYKNMSRAKKVHAAEKAGKDLSQFLAENPKLSEAEIARYSKQKLGKYFEEMRKARAEGEKPTTRPMETPVQETKAPVPAETGSPFEGIQGRKPTGLRIIEEDIKPGGKPAPVIEKETGAPDIFHQVLRKTHPELFPGANRPAAKGPLAEETPAPAEKVIPAEQMTPQPKTPEGAASTAEYARDADLHAHFEQYSKGGNLPAAMDTPEIVDLAREIGEGKLPKIRRKLGKGVAAGWFKPGAGGKIELAAEIFADPEMARKVLAHEIGHAVDWLPEKTLARGNLLGRVASLKKNMETFIPKDPIRPPHLTEQEEIALYEEAQKLARAEADQVIDAEITETIGVKPDDVLAIWNETQPEQFVGKELIDYVKSLDTKQKKSVIKQALKGRTPEELTDFTQTVRKKTGQQKVGGYAERLKRIYQELIEQELEKRKYVYDKQIRDELKGFTQKWKPFDPKNVPKKYRDYRFSGKELYADAVSALITNPGYLKAEAPVFYETFFNYLHKKPKVSETYKKIQEDIQKGPETLAANREQRLKAGFQKGTAARKKAIERSRTKDLHPIETILTWIDDKNSPVLNRVVRKLEREKNAQGELTKRAKQAIELRARIGELSNFSTIAQVYTHDLRQKLFRPLKEKEISVSDLDLYLFHKRVIGERFHIANPEGYYKELSQKDLAIKQRQWGQEKTKQIQEIAWDFRDIRENEVLPIIEQGGLIKPELMEKIKNNADYVTFSVAKFIEDAVGTGMTAKIYQQFGTFEQVGSLIEATMIKDIQMMRASLFNKMKREFESLALDPEINLLEPADLYYSQDYNRQMPKKPKDPKKDIFTVFHEGRPVHYYVDKAVADVFQFDPVTAHVGTKLLRWIGQVAREMFVSKNPVFMVRNMPRDFQETLKKIPEVHARNAPELAALYKEAYPEVVRYVFRGIMSPDIREMAKRGMFPKSRMWSGTDPSPTAEVIEIMEDAMLELDMESAKKYPGAAKRLRKLWDGADMAASTTEIVSKVAAYKYLMKNAPHKNMSQIGIDVQDKAGTPNIKQRGKLNWLTNNIFVFSTVGRNGLKASYASFRDNPGAYIWKTALFNLLPAMVRWGLKSGTVLALLEDILDEEQDPDQYDKFKQAWDAKRLESAVKGMEQEDKQALKSWAQKMIGPTKHFTRMMQGISEYDMSHYNCIPLYLRKDGKTVYLRLPQDYEGQFLSNIAAKVMRQEITGPKGALKALSQHYPYQLNPFLKSPYQWMQYFLMGTNPVDSWTGHQVLSRQEATAGGKYAAVPMAKHTWDQLGGRVIYEPAWGRLETDRTAFEEFLHAQPGKILGTFLKISDQGITEQIYNEIDEIRKQRAVESLEQEQAYIKLANGEVMDLQDILWIAMDKQHERHDKIIDMLTRKSGNAYERALRNAQTKEEKFAVIKVMLKNNYIQKPLE